MATLGQLRASVGVRKFMDVKIVQATINDMPEILELQKRAYKKEAVLYNDWTIPPLTQTLSEIQAEYEIRLFLKAQFEARIVGSVRALCNSGTCKIGRLIVHPDCQRQGIGALLMKSIELFFPMHNDLSYSPARRAPII